MHAAQNWLIACTGTLSCLGIALGSGLVFSIKLPDISSGVSCIILAHTTVHSVFATIRLGPEQNLYLSYDIIDQTNEILKPKLKRKEQPYNLIRISLLSVPGCDTAPGRLIRGA